MSHLYLEKKISVYIGITLVNAYLNWLKWFHFLTLQGAQLIILIDCIIFLPPFLDVIRISVSTVFFPCTARLWNSLPIECFPLIYDLNGFKSSMNKHPLSMGLSNYVLCMISIFFLFLATPYLLVPVQLCMELIPIKKSNLAKTIGQCFTNSVVSKLFERQIFNQSAMNYFQQNYMHIVLVSIHS